MVGQCVVLFRIWQATASYVLFQWPYLVMRRSVRDVPAIKESRFCSIERHYAIILLLFQIAVGEGKRRSLGRLIVPVVQVVASTRC